MKKLVLVLLLIHVLSTPLVLAQTKTLNDFFPLNTNNQFKYQYQSLEIIYDMLHPYVEIRDSGIVIYKINSFQNEDSTIIWSITESISLQKSIDTLYNSTSPDITYQYDFNYAFNLNERKDSLHLMESNPYLEIWDSPTRWSVTLIGDYFYRYSTEDSIKYIVQYNPGIVSLSDSLIFLKNIGLAEAMSTYYKGPNTPEYYSWRATLIDYQIINSIDGEMQPFFSGIYSLNQNNPNPFNPSTKISWQTPVSGWQTLKVYDVLGNEVATLVDEYRTAGSYEVAFKSTVGSRQLANGVYFYRLQAGDFVETKKMILLK